MIDKTGGLGALSATDLASRFRGHHELDRGKYFISLEMPARRSLVNNLEAAEIKGLFGRLMGQELHISIFFRALDPANRSLLVNSFGPFELKCLFLGLHEYESLGLLSGIELKEDNKQTPKDALNLIKDDERRGEIRQMLPRSWDI